MQNSVIDFGVDRFLEYKIDGPQATPVNVNNTSKRLTLRERLQRRRDLSPTLLHSFEYDDGTIRPTSIIPVLDATRVDLQEPQGKWIFHIYHFARPLVAAHAAPVAPLSIEEPEESSIIAISDDTPAPKVVPTDNLVLESQKSHEEPHENKEEEQEAPPIPPSSPLPPPPIPPLPPPPKRRRPVRIATDAMAPILPPQVLPLQPCSLRRSPRLALMPRISYVGMC